MRGCFWLSTVYSDCVFFVWQKCRQSAVFHITISLPFRFRYGRYYSIRKDMQDFCVIRPPFGGTSYKQKNKMRLRVNSQTHFIFVCDPCRIQTCNPHIRSVVLYSVELMDPEMSPLMGHALCFLKANQLALVLGGADETRTREPAFTGIRCVLSYPFLRCGRDSNSRPTA